ncbi:PREDICTED: ELMO domain-containing protein 2 isoform X2 [Crocodylus porosus]|nr:PREDICTED: ELMO domain-containing protein 2 isoform X2 [Crocodylus porosus]
MGRAPCAQMMLASLWACVYSRFLRGWLKWVLRLLTGRCELQRVCGGARAGAWRTHGIEHSLELSKNKVLRNAVYVGEDEVEKCVTDIMKEKKIIEQKNKDFKTDLQVCLLQISGYKQLYLDVENLRKVPYDSDNEEHEEELIKLWNLLMPHENLKARITKQWCNIGFQGDDPKTDFRGMGMLGLVNLVYFSKHYASEARQILSHSNHPKLGYSYAIVGINLTEMAYSLLKSGALKSHFYNAVPGLPNIEHFHQIYCYLVYEFDKFWFEEEPESIMHFNHYREKFHERVKALLLDYDIVLALQNRREQ